jgi:transposase InsO family protein
LPFTLKEALIVLVELGLVEQRYKAVLEVLNDGASVTDVARRYGVGRQTVHTWLRRYAAEGLGGLVDHSARPDTCPHQMPPHVEARVLEMRRLHPGWGPRTILSRLIREGIEPVPGRTSIYRALVRHQLIFPTPRKRKPSDYKRWERSRPMELWQMDVTAGVYLANGTRPLVVTGIDDHSRFCVCASVVARATAKPVCDALVSAMESHGVPESILTDNGKVFTGRFGKGSGLVLFDRICAENGIRHLLTAPRSPTTTGKVERFHKTMKREFLGGQIFDSIEEAQRQLDGWVHEYNSEREHQSLGNRPPAQRFALARREPSEPVVARPIEPDTKITPRLIRRVRTNGTVSLMECKYHVGRYLAGQNVEVVLKGGLVEIFSDSVLVATHARKHPPELDDSVHRQALAAPASRPSTDTVVIRKVDKNGAVRFAGSPYWVGQAYKRRQVEVALVNDTVQIWGDGKLLRTHPIRHDRRKEHGAFANPSGRPDRINAA